MKPLIILILSLFFIGCDEYKPTEQEISDFYSSSLKTVNYEGHKFIIYDGYREGGIVHHPDCHCHQKRNPMTTENNQPQIL